MPQFNDIIYLLPELILLVGAIALLMFGAFNQSAKIATHTGAVAVTAGAHASVMAGAKLHPKAWGIGIAAVILFGLAFIALLFQLNAPENNEILSGLLRIDDFGRLVKLFILAGAAFSLLIGWRWFIRDGSGVFELPVLMIFAVIGMTQMVAANNLVVLFLGLELQNLALYVLASSQRETRRSSEAGLKYFVLGALSSGLLL